MAKYRVQGYITADIYKWIQELIESKYFASESHAVERALKHLRASIEGKVLTK